MLARFHVPVMANLTAMALKRKGEWIVIDGNYHLIAALAVKAYRYGKLKCPITWVGLVIPAREESPLS